MKTIRNYRFVLTVLDNEQLNAGECRIANDEVSGERMFASECHYYAEKNIIECIKDADKRDALGEYYDHTYCIYKETKPKTETIEREEDGKKITETRELPTEANNYRQECQRCWMSHCDYVYLWTGSERINLTRMPESKRIELLKQFNIPE